MVDLLQAILKTTENVGNSFAPPGLYRQKRWGNL